VRAREQVFVGGKIEGSELRQINYLASQDRQIMDY